MFTEHPNILHYFSENHDKNHPRVSTLPTGFPHNPTLDPSTVQDSLRKNMGPFIPLNQRTTRIFVTDRIRGGPWFQARRDVAGYCVNTSSAFCRTTTDAETGANHEIFVHGVQNAQFIMCVHGGGLDPSPKAWESLFMGSIPIIEHG
jgi:hypothetical protein